jgi:hypothetical protein
VPKPDFLLEFLIVPLDAPAQLGKVEAAVRASAVRWPTPGIVRAPARACASGWQSAVAEALISWAAGSARKPWPRKPWQ